MKKDGGTIKNWEVHDAGFTKAQIDQVYPGENLTNKIISGEILHDPTGRWLPGYHIRTSLIVKLDRKKGVVETRNTIYKLQGVESRDPVARQIEAFGAKITDVFY